MLPSSSPQKLACTSSDVACVHARVFFGRIVNDMFTLPCVLTRPQLRSQEKEFLSGKYDMHLIIMKALEGSMISCCSLADTRLEAEVCYCYCVKFKDSRQPSERPRLKNLLAFKHAKSALIIFLPHASYLLAN